MLIRFPCFASLLLLAGCSSPNPPIAELPIPTVSVAKPIADRTVQDTQQFIATLQAAESIEVRARVTGYLKEVRFKAGQEVVKNETVLFVIDRRPFEAALKKAEGEMKIAEAELRLAKKDNERIAKLLESKNASLEDRDKALAQVEVSQAKLDANKAALDQAQINLDFTIVKADINGIVGRDLITPGNLVTADMTVLTTIVKPDPIFAYFDVDQRTVERYQETNGPKKGDPNQGADINLELGLDVDGGAFPYTGKVNFADVKLDPAIGSVPVRGIFWHKDLKKGQNPLQPGYTARVRVAVGPSFKPILIPDRAIGTDQGQKYVYVVGPDNKVEYRKVTLGNLYTFAMLPQNKNESPESYNLRAIANGLDGNEWVIVNGLQRVRPGSKVNPDEVDAVTERSLNTPAASATK